MAIEHTRPLGALMLEAERPWLTEDEWRAIIFRVRDALMDTALLDVMYPRQENDGS